MEFFNMELDLELSAKKSRTERILDRANNAWKRGNIERACKLQMKAHDVAIKEALGK